MTDPRDKVVVLVADDEPSTLALVSSHVRSRGYKVLEASDGDQAWQLAHENLPDLVILDVMMPGMSGWEVCRKIREVVSLAHTGVIMLTGIGENLNEMTSPLYGADEYIDKPFEFSDLDKKIERTLEERRRGEMGRPDDVETSARDVESESPAAAPSGNGAVRVPRMRARPAEETEPSSMDEPDPVTQRREPKRQKAPPAKKPAAKAASAAKKAKATKARAKPKKAAAKASAKGKPAKKKAAKKSAAPAKAKAKASAKKTAVKPKKGKAKPAKAASSKKATKAKPVKKAAAKPKAKPIKAASSGSKTARAAASPKPAARSPRTPKVQSDGPPAA